MANIIRITDSRAPDLQIYTDLTHRDPQKSGPLFLAESEKVIEYALHAGCRPVSLLMEQKDIDNSPLHAKWNDIPVYTGTRDEIRSLTGYVLNRGFLCALERPAMPSEESIWNNAGRVVLLRNISDPTDLGAIFRSAAALDIDGILIGEGCCDPLYRRAVRVSMGTVFQIPWAYHSHPGPSEYHTILVSSSPSGTAIDETSWRMCKRLAIVLDGCELPNAYRLPLRPDTEPLNMAAASAVLFWMLRKP